ncbi:Phage tail collar domain-containing protein [Magnetospirillum sp. LM-5]|uniref:phage tail protein n=1 Tax=Magnetospirillum sp. LM-5 TaxID=2681466 RepID=UPI001383017F|nr:tail fiber protein [Magnetospirillum sp. LM-5]CAA7623868.1 Phage tail collar domain-containing protein [Magnetospirillum sp. LM-5]
MIAYSKALLSSGAAVLALSAGLIVADASPAQACGVDPTIGEVCVFAFRWCPEGYVSASGQQLAVNEYAALYSLVQNIYGGNSQNFGVPDMRGRNVVSTGQGPGTSLVQLGAKAGQEYQLLSINAVPLVPHDHTASFTGTGGGVGSPLAVTISAGTGTGNASTASAGQTVYLSGSAIANQNPDPVTLSGPYATGTPATFGNLGGIIVSGGGGGITGGTVTLAPAGNTPTVPMSIIPPQMGLTYCIVGQGLYPNRPN